jgi:CheY-like chemotaxis protein
VEDDANERSLLASYLQMCGLEITVAHDGQDALDFLSLHAVPDVVLLDMHMPRCDGKQLVRRIRADAALAGVKLFAVSGTNPSSLGIPTGALGIDRWFAKPIDPEHLVAGISAELGIPAVAV